MLKDMKMLIEKRLDKNLIILTHLRKPNGSRDRKELDVDEVY